MYTQTNNVLVVLSTLPPAHRRVNIYNLSNRWHIDKKNENQGGTISDLCSSNLIDVSCSTDGA